MNFVEDAPKNEVIIAECSLNLFGLYFNTVCNSFYVWSIMLAFGISNFFSMENDILNRCNCAEVLRKITLGKAQKTPWKISFKESLTKKVTGFRLVILQNICVWLLLINCFSKFPI